MPTSTSTSTRPRPCTRAGGPRPVEPGIAARWVDLEHLHFAYPDGFEALRGVDLRLARGEKVALVGPNGAGKSTLMLHLNGIHLPSHGTVRIGGVAGRPQDGQAHPGRGRARLPGPRRPALQPDRVRGRRLRAAPHGRARGRDPRPRGARPGGRGDEPASSVACPTGCRSASASASPWRRSCRWTPASSSSTSRRPAWTRAAGASSSRSCAACPQTLLVSTHDMRLVAEVFPRMVVMDDGLVVRDGPTEEVLADEPFLEAHGLEAP